MKDALYRGKRISDGKWIRGYLFQHWGKSYILWGSINRVPSMVEVIPDTVGESIDMIDDYDNEVFEGDILEFEGYMGDNYYIQIAKSDDAPHNFIMGYRQKPESDVRGICEGMFVILESLPKSCRVIGNIHNKELEMFNHERDNI